MKYLLILFFGFLNFKVFSQNSFYNNIGKNRIQYKSFKWNVIHTNNFEIYYNSNNDQVERIASEHLENNFSRMTSLVGHQPYIKTKVFIFNSESDMNQSNIGINETDKYLNTNTNYNNKIQFKISFENNIHSFKKNLDYKFSKVLINDLMRGNISLTKRFGKISSFRSIPDWFSEGAAKFLGYGWDIEMDNVIRDYFLTQNKKKLKKITEIKSGYIGQSIWNYISVTYGKGSISNIINLTKIIRNPEKAIASSLGLSFNNFINNWSNFYSNKIKGDYILPNDSSITLTEINNRYKKINDIKINSLSDKYVFSTEGKNYKKIILYNEKNKKFKTIDRLKNKNIGNLIYLQWTDDQSIAYNKTIRDQINIIKYNSELKKKTYKSLEFFKKISGFSYNSNQSLIAVSGNINNQNDIYLLSTSSDNMKKLTDDMYDDIHPTFFPNSTSIAFSSNRPSPIISSKYSYDDEKYYNIYAYDLDTTKNILHQITKTISNDIKAKGISKNELIYLSDLNGVFNLHKYDPKDGYKQISNLRSNIINYDFNIINKRLTYNSIFEGINRLSSIEKFDIDQSNFSTSTARVINIQRNALIEKKRAQDEDEDRKKNVNFKTTEDFEFKDDKKVLTSVQKNIQKSNNKNTSKRSYEYTYSFIKNNFNSFLRVDPLEGFGTQVETDFIELFEDHNLYAKAFMPLSSLKSSDIFSQYSYLKHRIDFKISLDRKIIYAEDSENYIYHKYSLNQIKGTIAYPISNFLRFEISPQISISKFYDLDYRVLNNTPPPFLFFEKNKFIGYNLNLLYDDTKKVGMNLEVGSKMRINFKNFDSDIKKNSFKNISVDFIHHQSILNNIILSTRIFYGNSFGNNPYKYLVGGVNNSLFGKKEEKGINDPLYVTNGVNNINFLFGEFINLRGYNFKKFDGFKALVLNTELRIPVTKAVIGRTIKSNFLNNLQIVGFFDLGSSWNVNSPFSKKNDVNTWYIKEPGSVFQAEIENSKNPWLASYGFGFRSYIMDYYVKLDIAKPIEDYRVGSTKYHFSIGYSF